MEYGARLGPFIKEGAEASAALEACPVSETLQKYSIQPPLEGGFVLAVTVEVNRVKADTTAAAIWNVFVAAKAALDAEIAQTLMGAGAEYLKTLANLRGPRPANPTDNELNLRWGGGSPEERRPG